MARLAGGLCLSLSEGSYRFLLPLSAAWNNGGGTVRMHGRSCWPPGKTHSDGGSSFSSLRSYRPLLWAPPLPTWPQVQAGPTVLGPSLSVARVPAETLCSLWGRVLVDLASRSCSPMGPGGRQLPEAKGACPQGQGEHSHPGCAMRACLLHPSICHWAVCQGRRMGRGGIQPPRSEGHSLALTRF